MKCQIIFLISFVIVFFAAGQEAKPTEQVCEPGSIIKKDCNQCRCNKSGTDMLCTRKSCSESIDGLPQEGREKRDAQEDDEICKPGEVFKRDCNNCQCPPSGRKSEGICTLLACFEGKLNI